MAGLTAFGVGSAAAAGGDYDVVEVSAGETYRVDLGDGETFENTLIDITADGAEFFISARSNNWEIRNIGIRGQMPSDKAVNAFRIEVPDENATGLIENVYLGDGDELTYSQGGANRSGIWVVWTHAGDIELRNVNLQNWSDNGLYASAPGNSSDHPNPGNGGTVRVHDSYSANNDISNFRLGTNGSYLKNCVAWNGTHREYMQPYNDVELVDCDLGGTSNQRHIQVGSSNWNAGADASVTVSGTSFDEDRVNYSSSQADLLGSAAGAPEHRIPQGVPQTAEEAASGTGAEGTDSGTDSTDTSDETQLSDDAHLVAFITEQGASRAMYDFTASGPVEYTEAPYETPSGNAIEGGTWSSVDYIGQDGDTWQAGGGTGGGYGDAFLVDGPVESVDLDSDAMWIELDGEAVTPEELIQRTASGESGTETEDDLVAFVTEQGASRAMYDFTASGPVEFTEAPYETPSGNVIEGGTWSSVDYVEQDGDTWQAGGGTGGGYGDAFLVSGPVESVNLDSDAMWIELNGEAVTPEELIERTASNESTDQNESEDSNTEEELPNTIVVDGTQSSTVSVYEFSVSGDVEPAPDLTSVVDGGLSWDSIETNVTGDTVTGVVGMAKDGYRFSGEITSEEIQGDATVNVETSSK